MPELPEAETIRLGLQKYLVGHKIEDVEIKVPKLFQGDKKNLIGARFKEIKRAGKGLIFELDNDYVIAAHIKLTGQFIYRDSETAKTAKVSKEKVGALPSKLTHIAFKLDKNAFLYYNDARRFGWIKVVKKDELKELHFFKELGPEPFKDLTFSKFIKILKSSGSSVKVVLMDQKKIGGIGNIYANDALFLAKIDPRRKANSLTHQEAQKLDGAIIEVLKRGLKYGGSSEINFVNALGEEGSYQEHSLVYGKEGQKCQKCGGKIKKFYLGGRGTYFCPACQS